MDQVSVPPPVSGPVPPPVRRRRSIIGPVILISFGVIFLLANVVPGFHPWGLLSRYWPVILIVVGLGKVWDYYSTRGEAPSRYGWGVGIALAVLLALIIAGGLHGSRITKRSERHLTRSVELQGATSVTAKLEMPAGTLNIRGGSEKLVDADFRYREAELAPQVDYAVTAGNGQLDLTQKQAHAQFGTGDDTWDLQFNKSVPLDLSLDLGAGQNYLKAGELNLTHLEVNIGAGQMTLDLTGPRKQDLVATVEGGVGQATIRLPKDIGVRVHASGGIGSVDAEGLTKQGDEYLNAAYGKTPASIDLTVNGGVGEIDLQQEP